ncbi:MAG TPA: hypothetical protein VG982_01840 [Candidatus Paceibacterota bacterium]|nr:hypothetical protein [Candidatus Paceibacterota bacterium]
MDNNDLENIVGPQAEDRPESVDETVMANGQPLWMAFLDNPDALVISPDEVQDAKNAFAQFQREKPETISQCQNKSIDECRKIITGEAELV